MHINTVSLRRFAHEHDSLPAFAAGYIALSLLCAAFFNLGVYALLIICHASLDVVKYREHHGRSWRGTAEGVVREGLGDITLLAIGLVLSVYLHHGIGISSVSGLFRIQEELIRGIALMIPKFEIMNHFLTVVLHVRTYMERMHPKYGAAWSGLDILCFHLCAVSVLLIMFAAPLMNVPQETILGIFLRELMPHAL